MARELGKSADQSGEKKADEPEKTGKEGEMPKSTGMPPP
jgi:hypothetical protein